MTRVLLFDIDNTLLWTGGAGGLAMNLAFGEIFGIDDGFAPVEFGGRSDLYILQEGLRCHGIEGAVDAHLEQFRRRYYELLPGALRQKSGHLMPGFPQLLEALSQRAHVRLGLATGNFRQAARLKLEHYGLDKFFRGGAFGEESLDRAEIVRSAIERIGQGTQPSDILVIGDTPHDISSALESGVVAVGVATGKHTVEELRESGAQLVFPDFADWQTAAPVLSGEA